VARDSVMTISDEQYRQKGVATASLFPDSEAFIEYKAFCAIWKNWQDAVESVNRTVYLVAFDSAYRPRPRTLGELYEGGREDR